MSLDRDVSFADHPSSDKYWKLLNGSSSASIAFDRGLSGAASAAGKVAKAFGTKRAAAKERKRTERGIESGEIQDLR